MVWIGDIDIPILQEKDTSIDRDIVQKNFVDSPPQRFELTPNLESGTYSGLLNEKIHPRSESFKEQIDAVRSLPYRNASECATQSSDSRGYIAVDSATANIIPSLQIRETELDLRFLPIEKYKPAFKLNAQNNSDFNVTEESVIAIPFDAEEVRKNDALVTEEFTLTGEETDFIFVSYSSNDIVSFLPTQDISLVERLSPVRVFSGGERIYSHSSSVGDFILNNGLTRVERDGAFCDLEIYDGTWQNVATFELDGEPAYASDFDNYYSKIDTIQDNSVASVRGFPTTQVTVNSVSTFNVNVPNVSGSSVQMGYYHSLNTTSGYELIIVTEDSDSNITTTTGGFEVSNLDPAQEYTFHIGFVPSQLTPEDVAQYSLTTGQIKRTLKQR